MLHTCVRIFDVMGTVEIFLELNGAQIGQVRDAVLFTRRAKPWKGMTHMDDN